MASYEEVDEIIVRPMQAIYRAPDGMNGDVARLKAVRDQFCKSLSVYDAATLRRAWERVVVRHYGWEWPTLNEIVREASLCS